MDESQNHSAQWKKLKGLMQFDSIYMRFLKQSDQTISQNRQGENCCNISNLLMDGNIQYVRPQRGMQILLYLDHRELCRFYHIQSLERQDQGWYFKGCDEQTDSLGQYLMLYPNQGLWCTL